MALAHCFLSFLAVLNRARWPLTRPRLPFTPLALVFQCHLILVRPALFRDQVVVIEGRCLLSRVPGPACLAIVARLLREHNDLSVRNIAAISCQIVWLQGKGRSGIQQGVIGELHWRSTRHDCRNLRWPPMRHL